jgi:hypothetical protein
MRSRCQANPLKLKGLHLAQPAQLGSIQLTTVEFESKGDSVKVRGCLP